MGSVAYGVSSDTSDVDIYGRAIPPRDDIFPHLRGEVPGFGTPKAQFQLYSVLLTGIHLMRTGAVEANLVRLNEAARLTQVDDLIARKLAGPERSVLGDGELEFPRREYERLRAELEAAHRDSRLPERPTARPALNDLLVRLRLGRGE